MTRLIYILLGLLLTVNTAHAQLKYANDSIENGAAQTDRYLDKLGGKRVAFGNQPDQCHRHHTFTDSLLRIGNIISLAGVHALKKQVKQVKPKPKSERLGGRDWKRIKPCGRRICFISRLKTPAPVSERLFSRAAITSGPEVMPF